MQLNMTICRLSQHSDTLYSFHPQTAPNPVITYQTVINTDRWYIIFKDLKVLYEEMAMWRSLLRHTAMMCVIQQSVLNKVFTRVLDFRLHD